MHQTWLRSSTGIATLEEIDALVALELQFLSSSKIWITYTPISPTSALLSIADPASCLQHKRQPTRFDAYYDLPLVTVEERLRYTENYEWMD
jgi:hypothetical protein